jgi:hypothetical protein
MKKATHIQRHDAILVQHVTPPSTDVRVREDAVWQTRHDIVTKNCSGRDRRWFYNQVILNTGIIGELQAWVKSSRMNVEVEYSQSPVVAHWLVEPLSMNATEKGVNNGLIQTIAGPTQPPILSRVYHKSHGRVQESGCAWGPTRPMVQSLGHVLRSDFADRAVLTDYEPPRDTYQSQVDHLATRHNGGRVCVPARWTRSQMAFRLDNLRNLVLPAGIPNRHLI